MESWSETRSLTIVAVLMIVFYVLGRMIVEAL